MPRKRQRAAIGEEAQPKCALELSDLQRPPTPLCGVARQGPCERRLDLAAEVVGRIVGRGGWHINRLRHEHKVHIDVGQPVGATGRGRWERCEDGRRGATDGDAGGRLATRVGSAGVGGAPVVCVTVRGASAEQVQLACAAVAAMAGDGDGGLGGDDCGELADWSAQGGSSQTEDDEVHAVHAAAATLHQGTYPDTDTQYQSVPVAALTEGPRGCCCWEYMDAQGERQGPFTTEEMRGWYQGGYLPGKLRTRRVRPPEEQWEDGGRFVPLSSCAAIVRSGSAMASNEQAKVDLLLGVVADDSLSSSSEDV
jgi:hypothetical protein